MDDNKRKIIKINKFKQNKIIISNINNEKITNINLKKVPFEKFKIKKNENNVTTKFKIPNIKPIIHKDTNNIENIINIKKINISNYNNISSGINNNEDNSKIINTSNNSKKFVVKNPLDNDISNYNTKKKQSFLNEIDSIVSSLNDNSNTNNCLPNVFYQNNNFKNKFNYLK